MLPLSRAKRRRTRQWVHRKKVSAIMSERFPWNVVFGHLKGHPRSLILVQMVDKNFSGLIRADVVLWKEVYILHIHDRYMFNPVNVPHNHGCLRLYKGHNLTDIPTHDGNSYLAPNMDFAKECGCEDHFSSYVRKALALKFGHHCCLCGCRYRHKAYWSLGMRVCGLCMAANTITTSRLWQDYGLTMSDIMGWIKNKVFYFTVTGREMESHPCVPFEDSQIKVWWSGGMETGEWKTGTSAACTVLWLPHLRKAVDLASFKEGHKDRKEAAMFLTSAIRRNYITRMRNVFWNLPRRRKHVDLLVQKLYQNEKARAVVEPRPPLDCLSWAFGGSPRCGITRHEAKHKKNRATFWRTYTRFRDAQVDQKT
jgi:hypothetical protein